MALMGRSPVKLVSAPSTSPQEAMTASLQAHIDELVQKNRTFEHTINKLKQALEDEKGRGIEAVNRLKLASQRRNEEWREVCDSVLASHRIVHLRTRIELDKARIDVLNAKKQSRKEQIMLLERDWKLTLFQAREMDLEAQIAERDFDLENITEQNERDAETFVAERDETIASLHADIKKVETQRKEAAAKLKAVEAEKATLQAELRKMREEHAALAASVASTSTKLERAALQLDGAKSTAADLETSNAELKRTNADLKRQLDKWQNLETKGGAEVEESRKRRIELEVQLKELQARTKELEKLERDQLKDLEKERRKVEKLKKEIDRLADVAEEAQNLASKAHDEADDKERELTRAHKLISKLQATHSRNQVGKGDTRKERVPAHEVELPSSDIEEQVLPPSEREVEVAVTPVQSQQRNKGKAKAVPQDESGDEQPAATAAAAAKKRKNAQAEAASQQTGKGEEKGKVVNAVDEPDEPPPTKAKRKGKEKAADSEDEGYEEAEVPKPKPKPRARQNARAPSVEPARSAPTRKPSSSQATKDGEEPAGDGEDDAQPKKKKKRLFAPAAPVSFDWDSYPKVDGGLGIPTDLSPLKPSETAPKRSVIGRVGSALSFGWT